MIFDATASLRQSLKLRVILAPAFFLRVRLAVFVIRIAALLCPLEVEVVEDEART